MYDLGEKVNTSKVEPNIVKKAVETLEQYPKVKCFLMECTESVFVKQRFLDSMSWDWYTRRYT